MKNIRINFITASLGKGGAERVVSELSNCFSKMNYDVRIIKLCYKDSVYEIDNNVEVIDFSGIEITNPLDLLFKRAVYLRRYIIRNSSERDIYISFQDYVSNIACLAFLGRREKLIISERNDPLKSTIVNKILRKVLYIRGDGFVFQTSQAQEYFPKYIREKSTVIFNPIKENLPLTYSIPNNKRIIAVGRLTEQKNHKLLLSSYEMIKKIHCDSELYIYGDGELKDELCEYINAKDLKDVHIMNFTENIFDEMLKARVYVLTSDFEGMPNSLMEAMAIGLPCVSTDCRIGGPRELIGDNEYGMLVEVNNATELCETVSNIICDINLSKELSDKAREKMNEFSLDKICNQWLNYFKEVN